MTEAEPMNMHVHAKYLRNMTTEQKNKVCRLQAEMRNRNLMHVTKPRRKRQQRNHLQQGGNSEPPRPLHIRQRNVSKNQHLPAAGTGSSRAAAPAERSTASAVLAAGGDTTRQLAGAGSCEASSLASAEAEAIGSELLRRHSNTPRARHSADVTFS